MSDGFEWPSPIEAELHIRNELTRLGIPFREDHNSFRLVCPLPHPGGDVNTHKNRSIKKDGRTGYCFVCQQTMSWMKLGPLLGAQKFGKSGLIAEGAEDFDFAAAIRARMARTALSDEESHEVPKGMVPWQGSWRGLSHEFLQTVNAQRWYQTITLRDGRSFDTERIWFPCVQAGEYVGYAARRLDKREELPWYNAPWMKSAEVLYPFDRVRAMGGDAVVIVEGPFDALNLIAHGVPAMATLGAGNFGQKEALLVAAGYKRAFVLFDNDATGYDKGPKVAQQIARVIPTQIMWPPKDRQDPGKMEPGEISWFRNFIYSTAA